MASKAEHCSGLFLLLGRDRMLTWKFCHCPQQRFLQMQSNCYPVPLKSCLWLVMKCGWAKLWSLLFTIIIKKKNASVPFCWQIHPWINDIVAFRSWKERVVQPWNGDLDLEWSQSICFKHHYWDVCVCCASVLWEIFVSPSQAYILNLFAWLPYCVSVSTECQQWTNESLSHLLNLFGFLFSQQLFCVAELNELPIFFGIIYFWDFLVAWAFLILWNEAWLICVLSEDRDILPCCGDSQ